MSLPWILMFSLFTFGRTEVKFANIYNSDMVLQMAPKTSYVWGHAEPFKEVTVSLDDESYTTPTGPDGKWGVSFLPRPAGGPYVITATFEPELGEVETAELTGVMFGDVWVCGGGRNMEFEMEKIYNSADEIENAKSYPQLRLMKVGSNLADFEMDDVEIDISWTDTNSSSIMDFSATCLLYGERLSSYLGDRPIGLIQATYPYATIEAWLSPRTTKECFTPPTEGVHEKANGAVWNGTFFALTKLAVGGALWYHGEENVEYQTDLYACHFTKMVADWQNAFHYVSVPSDVAWRMPFGYVQVGPSPSEMDDAWGMMRWLQTNSRGTVPNTYIRESFMATTYDLSDPSSPFGELYPRDKQTVASRLANAAHIFLYNGTGLSNGPVVESIKLDGETGNVTLTYNEVIVSFHSSGFAYSDEEGSWVPIPAENDGNLAMNLMVNLTATQLSYGWVSKPCEYKQCAVYGHDQLPAQPWIWLLDWNQNN